MTRRERILGHIDDLVSNFLYYDRQEDEDLRPGDIKDAVMSGEVSIEEMVHKFEERLRQGLQ